MDNQYNYLQQCEDGCTDEPETTTETTEPPVWTRKFPRSVIVKPSMLDLVETCQFATYSLLENKLTNQFALRFITCKRWGCPACARVKIWDLAWWVKLAVPNKLLTLTVDPAHDDNPELAWMRTAPLVPELIRALRKRFGTIEYLRVCEKTTKGWPHYHLMVRATYLPQPVIKHLWENLSGAKIVDIREVKQFFNSFQYLVKYLTKLRRIDWTDRHVTYSRRFFPTSISRTTAPSEWHVLQRVNERPLKFLSECYNGNELIQTSPEMYLLPGRPAYRLLPETQPNLTEKQQTNMGW